MGSPKLVPVSSEARIALIDALRGFALCGILVINIKGFSGFEYSLDAFPDAADRLGPGTGALDFLTKLFFQGKFYSIFSFLFGLGFSIQLARGEGKPGWLRVYARRLRILSLIGVLHACLLWAGDILWIYALLGFALLAFRQMSSRSILVCAVALLLAPIAFFAACYWIAPGYNTDNLIPNAIPLGEWMRLIGTATYPVALGLNLEDLLFSIKWRFFTGRFFSVLGLFLLGFWAGRHRILQEPERHAKLLQRVLWIGLIVGMASNVVSATTRPSLPILAAQGILSIAARALGAHPLGLAYVAAFVLLWRRAAGQRILARFVPMGRMALSNYLMQTMIGVSVYYGYGLGWYGRMPTLITMLVVLPSILLLQVAVSDLWLRHFRYGPAEWVWRQATYGRHLPLRIKQAPAPVGST